METILAYLSLQDDRFSSLKRLERNYKKSPKDRITKGYIETRIELLESLRKEFKETHIQISMSIKPEQRSGVDYYKAEIPEAFDECYTNYKSLLRDDLRAFNVTPESLPETKPSITDVKLPRIQLPTFSGNYNEWQTFFDLFSSLIHNNASLSAVQKLHYLKSSLSGEAEHLIRNLPTTELNYDAAWQQLTNRFNNKRFNSNAILKTLFGQRQMNTESAAAIKSLLDTTSSCLTSLTNLGVPTNTWDVIVVFLVVTKLDRESMRQWEMRIGDSTSNHLPTWKELREFMESRFRTLEMIESTQYTRGPNSNKRVEKVKAFAVTNDNKLKCIMCKEEHHVFNCKEFSKLTPIKRREFVQSNRLCFNCLAPSHSVKTCRHTTSCKRCGRKHHSLLHYQIESQAESGIREETHHENTKRTTEQSGESSDMKIVANFAEKPSQVLLATAVVKVRSRLDVKHLCRVLIDQGSQASFVTEHTVQTLGLKRTPINGHVSALGNGELNIKYIVSLLLESRHSPQHTLQVNAFVLGSLTALLPSTYIKSPDWLDIENLSLADPGYTSPGRIDILLGAEVYSELLLSDMIKHPQGQLLAQNTIFGWVISGKVSQSASANEKIINLHVRANEDQMLKRFWEVESEPNRIEKRLNSSEEKCEEIFDQTTTRDETGRFVVRLPFSDDDPECQYGRSEQIVERRFKTLERRLNTNEGLKLEYSKVIEGYLNSIHMAPISDLEKEDIKAVYLPHHAVVREDKQTTKVRIVFDASCKGVNGVSLNDNLLVGPKIQQDLRHLLMRWRLHPIGIVADIVKMYRQVRVHEDDTRFQRILWRDNPDKPIDHYKLLTLTFGTSSAPYLAVKCLQRLAEIEGDKFQVAAEIVKNDFYVDDLMTGCETKEDAVLIYNEINNLLRLGGFQLQKWNSNDSSLLQYIGQDNQSSNESLVIKEDMSAKVLGIQWNRVTDSFHYTIDLPDLDGKHVTKRMVLSDIARIYDPLGWAAPVIVIAKSFIQKLWKSNLDWDKELTSELLNEWLHFRRQLGNLKDINIPRWMHHKRGFKTELHAFADASQSAYAAAVYLKTISAEGDVSVFLITAKTKVSPIEKELSIPRLELCGVVLAAKLAFEVSQVLSISKEDIYAWSDSTVVLAWLRGFPSRWTTFVSNRVSEILTILDAQQIRHVSTNFNPADIASRGVHPENLNGNSLWWHGPEWLHQPVIELNNSSFTTNEEERNKRAVEVKSLVAVNRDKVKDVLEEEQKFLWSKYSSFHRMLRVVAYLRRVLNFKKQGIREICSKAISPLEKEEALLLIVKQVQSYRFQNEIRQLTTSKNKDTVAKSSELHSLCPFIDKQGIMRVGGRIHLSELGYDSRHPVVLPEISHLTQVIIADAHYSTMHGGPQVMLNYIRTRFWIIRARNQVKKFFRQCVTCLRYSQRKSTPLMGQMPEVRLKPNKPFLSSGVDYAGPINIRFSPGRGAKSYKGYICLFVCMVTRAVHLEAVSDLTSKAFIAAFRRFTGRRGRCLHVYSDNGTNFVGAVKELQDMFRNAQSTAHSEIIELLSASNTTWHFIPPHSPNFGGLWEAGIKSTKLHLQKVVGDSTLTFEELSTVLVQIEACLNSRPVSYISEDPNDPLPLTPGHFLIGEPTINLADLDYSDCNVTGLSRWKLVQKISNQFWKRWSKDYLLYLEKRYKWTKRTSEPNVDDVVIMREDNMPPAKWPLGKIVSKIIGNDGVTRVVIVKCKNKLLKRPINKISILCKE